MVYEAYKGCPRRDDRTPARMEILANATGPIVIKRSRFSNVAGNQINNFYGPAQTRSKRRKKPNDPLRELSEVRAFAID